MNTDNTLPDSTDQPTVDPVTMILAAIADVAPELEPELAELDHDVDFWTELQLDSMDHLSVMTRLAAQAGRDIPERDYPRLTTINELRTYLGGRQ
ncbi:MAG: acyl carrier protein [Acidimicrobiales bacterium]|nr:MAG: acyl carrier protein [Acidimicrobiales bacterium]